MLEIMRCQYGSYLYGTNTPESDVDFKTIYVPSVRDILLQNGVGMTARTTKTDMLVKNTSDDVDDHQISIHKFMQLLKKGDMTAIELLFVPPNQQLLRSSQWEEVRKHRHSFISRNIPGFMGFLRHHIRNPKPFDGDWKPILHTMRILEEAIELLQTGQITFPRPNHVFLKNLRSGIYNIKDINYFLNQCLDFLEKIVTTSTLFSDKVDEPLMDQLIMKLHMNQINRSLYHEINSGISNGHLFSDSGSSRTY